MSTSGLLGPSVYLFVKYGHPTVRSPSRFLLLSMLGPTVLGSVSLVVSSHEPS